MFRISGPSRIRIIPDSRQDPTFSIKKSVKKFCKFIIINGSIFPTLKICQLLTWSSFRSGSGSRFGAASKYKYQYPNQDLDQDPDQHLVRIQIGIKRADLRHKLIYTWEHKPVWFGDIWSWGEGRRGSTLCCACSQTWTEELSLAILRLLVVSFLYEGTKGPAMFCNLDVY